MPEGFTVALISSGRRFIRPVDMQKRIMWHQIHLGVICVWVLFSGTMAHSFSFESPPKRGKAHKQRVAYHGLCSRITVAKYSLADRADTQNLDHSGLNLKVKFLGGGSNTLLDCVTDKLSCRATQLADDKLAAMRFLWEVTSDIGV